MGVDSCAFCLRPSSQRGVELVVWEVLTEGGKQRRNARSESRTVKRLCARHLGTVSRGRLIVHQGHAFGDGRHQTLRSSTSRATMSRRASRPPARVFRILNQTRLVTRYGGLRLTCACGSTFADVRALPLAEQIWSEHSGHDLRFSWRGAVAPHITRRAKKKIRFHEGPDPSRMGRLPFQGGAASPR